MSFRAQPTPPDDWLSDPVKNDFFFSMHFVAVSQEPRIRCVINWELGLVVWRVWCCQGRGQRKYTGLLLVLFRLCVFVFRVFVDFAS